MVIPSPAWPEHVEESAAEVDDPASLTAQTEAVDGPASDGPADDDSASDGPADDGPAYDGSARGPVMVMDDEPDIVDEPEEVANPASQQSGRDGPALDDDDPAGVASPAHHQNPAVYSPAVVDGPVAHGTPAGNTPAAGQDSSMLSDVSSLLFPSLPRAINQTTLIYFMSMWTLMQRRMDPGMAVPYAQARPTAQSTAPTPRDDDTPLRRSKTPPRTPDRWPRMPVRRSRTPVRRTRGLNDTRESTRSRSPIRRSSSSDSPPRDASPVNFSAALDSEDKVKDRSITDDEDEDGTQKKVSAAQYQLFRQAVMTSKGSFKVNPAKSIRASRAPSQYSKRRLFVRSRKVSKPRDWYFELSHRFEIWQAHRQHCCRSACQISERSDNSKYKSRGFETLRDLTKRRLFGYWDGAQSITFGSRRQWSHRSSILAGPALSQGYHGLYGTYCPTSQGRWRGREDNVVRDTEHQLFHVQAPYC